MTPRFQVPLVIDDLMRPPEDGDFLYAQDVVELKTLSPGEILELVEDLATELANKDVLSIEEQSMFDRSFSLVRDFKLLELSAKGMLMDSMCTNFIQLNASTAVLIQSLTDSSEDPLDLLQQCRSHSNAIQIYAFFLLCILTAEEADREPATEVAVGGRSGQKGRSRKKHTPQAWDWSALRTRSVKVLAAALQNDLQRIFDSQKLDENFVALIGKTAFKMMGNRDILEKPENKDCKEALYVLISTSAIKYNYKISTVATMIHMLHKHEHVALPFAELVSLAEHHHVATGLAVDLLRAVGQIDPSNFERDTFGADNVGLFLEELAVRLPRLLVLNLSVLMCHLDGKSYKIRNSLIKVIGTLLVKAVKDTTDTETSEGSRLRNEQALLNILIERIRDTSAHTRKHVLRTWAYLCMEHAVSIGHWNLVSDLAAGRLEDNAAIVRKGALQLLGTLLEYNPFGPQLRTAAFEATYEKYKENLRTMEPQDAADQASQNEPENETEAGQQDLEDGKSNPEVRTASGSTDAEGNTQELPGPQAQNSTSAAQFATDIGGLEQTRALVASLEAAVRFSKRVASAMPMLGQLLASSTIGDVEGAIQLLITCRKFDIDGSELCIRKMMPLVFSQESGISASVEDAFKTLYLKGSSSEMAASLIQLTLEASLADLASIEALVEKSVARGDISSGTLSALWNVFIFNGQAVTPDQCRGALTVLCMAAKSNPTVLRSHVQNILDVGFGRWASADVLLARYSCIALQRLSVEDRSSIKASHKIFTILSNLITGPGLPESCWYSAAEQALNAIYELHPMPEAFTSALLLKFSRGLFARKPQKLGLSPHKGDLDADNSSQSYEYSSVNAASISRFLFVAAQIALKHLVYIESCGRKLRKQRGDQKKAAANAAAEMSESQNQVCDQPEEENISKELGLNASDDAKLDDIVEQAENEIVSGDMNRKFLIGAIAPVVVKLCRASAVMHQNPKLQANAMLALCKLMVIDAEFCDKNLQLLFTVAQNSPEDSIRSNCVIALGDLALRFPNLLEPWLDRMYARVHDPSASVRKNSVLVLSHLILNDMIKVKGHISELAMHIEDEDQRISDLVKVFFHELSKKGNNPIYNLFPDVLSRLSCNEALSQNKFYTIMQFLMATIKKCKQMEGLIEKLCNRFMGTTDPRQWQSLAYCLSQLTYTQSCLRRLSDSSKLYEHALVDDEVFGHFKALIVKTRKLAKVELKIVLNELEERLVHCHNEKKELQIAALKAESHHQRTKAGQADGNGTAEEATVEDVMIKDEPLSEDEKMESTSGIEVSSPKPVEFSESSEYPTDAVPEADVKKYPELAGAYRETPQRKRRPSKDTKSSLSVENLSDEGPSSRSSPSIKLNRQAHDVDDDASTCSDVSELGREESELDAASTCSDLGELDELRASLDDASSTCSEPFDPDGSSE
ncbi:hypothetical protein R1flu_005338 [Riccia fluitans]|uniref:Condensin-1 complex subunit CAP-D2 n=1 Tax=Riccia fluitans TaxID=41844 RepID=A0ABD1YSW1_9MARC